MDWRTATIRLLEAGDIPQIERVFEEFGWYKSASHYERYIMEQTYELCEIYVAFVDYQFAGNLTVCWGSTYEPFRAKNIPEIADFFVLPKFRRTGIGSQLMAQAEHTIAKVSPIAGIGVGMTPDYGAAQRLYVLRGYVPDGLGLHSRDHYVRHGEQVKVDDDLVLYLTKDLS